MARRRYGDDMAYENSDAYVSEILALVRQQNIHQCNETQGILLEELEFKHMYQVRDWADMSMSCMCQL